MRGKYVFEVDGEIYSTDSIFWAKIYGVYPEDNRFIPGDWHDIDVSKLPRIKDKVMEQGK